MRLIINILLLVVVAILAWVLISTISDPVKFEMEKKRRSTAVIKKLIKIRKAQEAYRGITGEFAPNFDTLTEVLKTGKFKIVKVIGDPDDPNFTGEIKYDTIYRNAIDSIKALGLYEGLDSLKYVPFGEGATFDIKADTTTYQKTLVAVTEVGVPYKKFMGKFKDPSYSKFDNSYDPEKVLMFGSMSAPKLSGNWE